jgi:hypothetical protein
MSIIVASVLSIFMNSFEIQMILKDLLATHLQLHVTMQSPDNIHY